MRLLVIKLRDSVINLKMLAVTILHVLIISIVCSSSQLICGNNEVLEECSADCSYDYCPKNELQDRTPCPKPTVCPQPRCKCVFNYRRADNNTCIPTTDCPPFNCTKKNEVYDSCPSFCPSQRCLDATPTGECPFLLLFVIECSPACRCSPGHWRHDGACIPYHECPNIKTQLEDRERILEANETE